MNKNDIETQARWWNTFCIWEWPEDFPTKEPKDFRNIEFYNSNSSIVTRYNYIMPIMHDIENTIGKKECLRWHHIHNLGSTNLKFELWWFKYHNDIK